MQCWRWSSVWLVLLGVSACQRQERTLVDIVGFPDEVRTVVSAPGYETWYHGDAAGTKAEPEDRGTAGAQKFDDEDDQDRDLEDAADAAEQELDDEEDPTDLVSDNGASLNQSD
jgi:hypothetical protein